MVRTWWLGPLVLTLTGGSAVLAQGPTERATSVAVRERLMTITEQGKTPRRCRIIQTGTLPDGSRVYLVSAIDDGHRITVVQAPRKPDGSVSSTKFYHWSSEGKPPSAIASLVVQDDRPAENLALAETKPNETFSRTTQKLEVLPPLAVAKPRELKLPDLAPAPTLAPVKVEPSVVAIGSSSVVENNAEKGPLAKGKAADAGTKGKAADAGTKGAKAADAGTKGKAADAGTKGDKADSTALPHSRVAEGDPLKSPMEFQKPTKEKAEAGASLMDKLRKNLGLKDSTTSHAAEGSNKERGSNRDRQPGGRSMEAAGIAGQFGVGEGFPIMLGGQPANPPRFQDLPKPPYAPNLPGPDSNPYVASPDRGVSPGMSNAFTATSSTRPIPADFGNLPVKQNAFGPPSVPGPAPVAQVNLPLPGRNFLPPNALGMPHQATPLQALPGNTPAVLNLGKKKSKVDDDGVSNAFTDTPQLVGQPTQPTPLAPATLVTTAASSAKVNLDQPIRQLRESLLPSERELAIEAMAETDLRQQNEAASALLTAAFRDPAVTVRLCAIRTLALKLGHNPQILGALRTLKEDGDARIRAEAESALNQTGTSLPTPPSMPRPAAPRAFPIGS